MLSHRGTVLLLDDRASRTLAGIYKTFRRGAQAAAAVNRQERS